MRKAVLNLAAHAATRCPTAVPLRARRSRAHARERRIEPHYTTKTAEFRAATAWGHCWDLRGHGNRVVLHEFFKVDFEIHRGQCAVHACLACTLQVQVHMLPVGALNVHRLDMVDRNQHHHTIRPSLYECTVCAHGPACHDEGPAGGVLCLEAVAA